MMSSCTHIDDKDRILMNLVYECYTGIHNIFLLGMALPLLISWLFIFPYIAYRSLRHKFHIHILEYCSIRRSFGFLYNEYRIKAFYWEIVKLGEKSALVLIVNYLDGQPITKGALISSVLIFYIILTEKCRPF